MWAKVKLNTDGKVGCVHRTQLFKNFVFPNPAGACSITYQVKMHRDIANTAALFSNACFNRREVLKETGCEPGVRLATVSPSL